MAHIEDGPTRPNPSKAEESGIRLPPITLHGIGWAVNLAVGLVTLWMVAHGGHL